MRVIKTGGQPPDFKLSELHAGGPYGDIIADQGTVARVVPKATPKTHDHVILMVLSKRKPA